MATTKDDTIAALRAEVDQLRSMVDPRPKQAEPPPLDAYLKRALERMNGDVEQAADLFVAWTEQSSEVRAALQPLVREALERRLALVASAAE